jgi:ADP-heptose:LPS heptosyltransferase
VHVSTRADHVHNTQFNLDALRALDIPTPSQDIVFPIPSDVRLRMQGFVDSHKSGDGPVIALNPSGTWQTKRWGLHQFAELGDLLVEKFSATIVLLWGPDEHGDVKALAQHMKHQPVIPARTSILELGGLLAACDFAISNDAGPMHISAAMQTPTLGIFGPTNPELQGPCNPNSAWVRLEGLDCLGCNLTRCDINNICMRDLPASLVLTAFESMYKKVNT